MPITFVHVSDIHFGQEKKGTEDIIYNDDARAQLIQDAKELVAAHAGGHAAGVIVTGDIAYGGRSDEYKRAGQWLDELTAAIGCEKTSVQVVPGNHDIELAAITSGCRLMLKEIDAEGIPKLNVFLESELDSEVLYGRFTGYRPFSEGYNCPLDRTGKYASDKRFELAPGRILRFIGLNSALVCSGKDSEGKLLLGARQHVLPRTPGEELVVLSHHPLHWFRDSADARVYIESRARVLMTGHEHNPSLKIDEMKDGSDLMLLAAGATTPPVIDAEFTYTYNVITFDWHSDSEGLQVTIRPRSWNPTGTCFENDSSRLGGREPHSLLRCANFRKVATATTSNTAPEAAPEPVPENEAPPVASATMPDDFKLTLLRYFRDLTPSQRLAVLVKLKALPETWRETLTHAMERRVVDSLETAGRLGELSKAIDEVQADSKGH
jgi:predicted phosphodiesterase